MRIKERKGGRSEVTQKTPFGRDTKQSVDWFGSSLFPVTQQQYSGQHLRQSRIGLVEDSSSNNLPKHEKQHVNTWTEAVTAQNLSSFSTHIERGGRLGFYTS